jgi:diphthamide synthase (EF-2-diphthine--ammonia ligase)
VVFGDLFLTDVRAYRERLVAAHAPALAAAFPLWGTDTAALARRFVADGFRAILVCVDPRQVDAALCGREYDARFLADLPPGADPCGENGEFHTFVYDGPGFETPVPVARGDVVTRDGFVYCDLLPD